MAPIYKQLAEQYKDKAVFAKVDINANYQTASAQQIRSMPTFQLYLFGKKRDQFSGADVQRIQNQLASLVCESEMKNIEVTFDEFGGEAPDGDGETPWEARERRKRRRPCRN